MLKSFQFKKLGVTVELAVHPAGAGVCKGPSTHGPKMLQAGVRSLISAAAECAKHCESNLHTIRRGTRVTWCVAAC